MRLMSCRSAAGEILGIVEGERWLPAATVLAGGPRTIADLLAAGGEAVCVCDFEELLGLKQSTTSYHLKQLLDAGIVEREKRGSFAYFSLADGALERVRGLLVQPTFAA